jgi:hypothetical protein
MIFIQPSEEPGIIRLKQLIWILISQDSVIFGKQLFHSGYRPSVGVAHRVFPFSGKIFRIFPENGEMSYAALPYCFITTYSVPRFIAAAARWQKHG